MKWDETGRTIFERELRLVTSAICFLFFLFSFRDHPKSIAMLKLDTEGKAVSITGTPSLSKVLVLKVDPIYLNLNRF